MALTELTKKWQYHVLSVNVASSLGFCGLFSSILLGGRLPATLLPAALLSVASLPAVLLPVALLPVALLFRQRVTD